MDKLCCVCLLTKSISSFHLRKNLKPYSYCIECHNIYTRNHYKNNKAKYLEKSKKWNKVAAQRCETYIKSLSCNDCGFSFCEYPSVCDFHHTKGDKEFNVSHIKTHSFEKFMKEVGKCIALCSNCHRIRHHKNRLIINL